MEFLNVDFVFFAEVSLTAKKYYLASHSQENMLDWVNALHNAAVSWRISFQS